MVVTELFKAYPEAGTRSRSWVCVNDAAKMVEDQDLQQIDLGIQQWRAPVHAGPEATVRVAPMSARRRFLIGVLTNATNPKGIIFMVAVLPQFMTESRPLWTQLAVMAATTVAVDVVVMHGYALGASTLRGLMRSARAVRIQNRVFGGLLMVVGAGLFFVKRGGQHA